MVLVDTVHRRECRCHCPASRSTLSTARFDEFRAFYNHVLGGLTPAQAWSGMTITDVHRLRGQGRWVQSCAGVLIGYHLLH